MEILGNTTLHHADCLDVIKDLPDGSIDCILTDPPYLYLTGQKLERPFDEHTFFTECKRVLKKDGFIVLFGRGTSFYRWNTRLSDLGFNFKEEIVWDKSYCTSPLMAISRVHETVSIHTKGNGTINKVKIPYLEMKEHDINSICVDLKRFLSGIKNEKSLKLILDFIETNKIQFSGTINPGVTVSSSIQSKDRAVMTLSSIRNGMNECSIMHELREHYTSKHPTQKPVRLLERLLALTTNEGDTIFDPFSGSGSTAIACMNTNRKSIIVEIDEEYFNIGLTRVKNHSVQQTLF